MNIFNDMEAIFIGATAVAITLAAVLDRPVSATEPQASVRAAPHVVVVSAKRLTPEQKLQSLREEGQVAAARQGVARG